MPDKIESNDNAPEKKPRKRIKRSSALLAASRARSAVDQVLPNSSADVQGSNNLPDTGPVPNYKNNE
jgi:hypothetical protein